MSCFPNHSAGMQPCVNAASNIFDYLLDPNGYMLWLTDESNLGITYFSSSNYEKTGHQEFAGVVPADTSALVALHTQLLDELIHQHGLKNIIASYAEAPAPNQGDFDPLLLKADANIGLLEAAMANCKANPDLTHCQSTVDIAFTGLQEIVMP